MAGDDELENEKRKKEKQNSLLPNFSFVSLRWSFVLSGFWQ
jgi:hypothetical protein